MAWLKLTTLDGRKAILSTHQISEISERSGSIEVAIWFGGRLVFFRESVEDIGDMIEAAERRERVHAVACAILSNNRGDGLTSEQVWARAARFANMDPEQSERNT